MKGIDAQWAWSQVEAMADGSLSARDKRRMRAAMADDPSLREAVERARMLRSALRGLANEPVPKTLHRRLMRAAGRKAGARALVGRAAGVARGPLWSWATAAGTAAVATAVLMLATQPRSPAPAPGSAALREFELAMAYLQRSYSIAGEQVRRATERGLRDALELDGGADETGAENGNGG